MSNARYTDSERRSIRITTLGKYAVARPIADRLWEKVDKNAPNGCWEWKGYVSSDGYGSIWVTGEAVRSKRVHRLAYELLVGPIPPGLTMDHLCRNRRCVNPAHLEPVPAGVNSLRGNGPLARNARKTHCKYGHEFTDENTRYTPKGCRICRECKRRSAREQQKRNRKHPNAVGRGGYQRLKTHCVNGHEFTPDNTRITTKGNRTRRTCRACERSKPRQKLIKAA